MKSSHIFSAMLAAAIAFSVGCSTCISADEKSKVEEKTTQKQTAKKVKKAKRTLEEDIKIATTPVQNARHAKRHELKKQEAAANKDKIKILMLGDSITHQWEYKAAAKAKVKYIDPYPVLNLGCGGDRTQHTIWIVEKSGIPELIKPQLVTLMIGTNNSLRNDYRATVAGIKRILDGVRRLYPEAKILLYTIFPRGKTNTDPRRIENEKVNAEIEKFCDNKNIILMDIRKNFLTPEGVLEKSVMPDLLHPRKSQSYAIWGESLKPYFEKYSK